MFAKYRAASFNIKANKPPLNSAIIRKERKMNAINEYNEHYASSLWVKCNVKLCWDNIPRLSCELFCKISTPLTPLVDKRRNKACKVIRRILPFFVSFFLTRNLRQNREALTTCKLRNDPGRKEILNILEKCPKARPEALQGRRFSETWRRCVSPIKTKQAVITDSLVVHHLRL